MSGPKKLPVPEPWQELIDEWTKVLVAQNASPETLRTRINSIRTTARALAKPPSEITMEDLYNWAASKTWAPETRHSQYAAVKQFFAWFSAVTRTENPTVILPSVKRPIPPAKPAPSDAIREALSHADQRTELILTLAYTAGLRSGEIAVIQPGEDLLSDLTGYSLYVHGKGRKQRIVPLSDSTTEMMLKFYSPEIGPWLFPGKTDGHLAAHTISSIGSHALPGVWTMHTLRHRYGTQAYKESHNLIAVQRLLGHTSVATTQRYIQPPLDDMRRAMEYAQQL